MAGPLASKADAAAWLSPQHASAPHLPGRAAGGGGLSRRVVDLQALEKKGISHLEEKELKERNKRIQEDNRLELQKVGRPGRPHAGGRPSLVGLQGWFTPA